MRSRSLVSVLMLLSVFSSAPLEAQRQDSVGRAASAATVASLLGTVVPIGLGSVLFAADSDTETATVALLAAGYLFGPAVGYFGAGLRGRGLLGGGVRGGVAGAYIALALACSDCPEDDVLLPALGLVVTGLTSVVYDIARVDNAVRRAAAAGEGVGVMPYWDSEGRFGLAARVGIPIER